VTRLSVLTAQCLLVALLLAAAPSEVPAAGPTKDFRGTNYSWLPEKVLGGRFVEAHGGVSFVIQHVIAAGEEMFWLEATPMPVQSDSVHRVVDVIALRSTEGLAVAFCAFGHPEWPAVVVLTPPGQRRELRAWTVDLDKGTFVELAHPEGTCYFFPQAQD
jgi:hypothetical protein